LAAPLFFGVLLVGTVESASAQNPPGSQNPPGFTDVVEQVAAVVGDSVILMTEIDTYLLRLEAAQGWTRPETTSELMAFKAQVLDLLINEQLVIQDAGRDSTLAVSDEELEERLQLEINGQIRQFGTLSRLQEALTAQSMTMSVFRDQRRSAIRRQLLQERYMAKKGANARDMFVSEEELRTFFSENREQMSQLPPTIAFMNLQLAPLPTDSAKAEALAEADSVLRLLLEGEQDDFAELARQYSDGPSADDGGELGWVRRDGSFVEDFEEVAFQLAPGMVSVPTETDFGYHLIMVERVRGGERRIRHILFQPEITEADIAANLERATEYRDRLRAGEDMGELAALVEETVDTLDLTVAEINQISSVYASALQTAEPGDVVGPLRFDGRDANTLGLIKVTEVKGGGEVEFEDVREQIETRLKSTKLTEGVVESLRNRVFVEIRLTGAR
jgi:peptidyl-prolyl cis-trans isomerase SurA